MIIGDNFFWLSWGQYGKMGLDDLKSSLVLVPEGKPPKKVKSKQIDALDHDDNYQSQRRLNKRQRRCRYWSQEEHRRQCNQDQPDCTHHTMEPIINTKYDFMKFTDPKYCMYIYIIPWYQSQIPNKTLYSSPIQNMHCMHCTYIHDNTNHKYQM